MNHVHLNMIKSFLLFLVLTISLCTHAQNQEPMIDVLETEIKVASGKEDELYLAFNTGDQIVFNMKVDGKKTIDVVEIIEYPSNKRFAEYKSSRIENKLIRVSNKAVYKFRFHNSNILFSRVCNVHIQRIPANDSTIDFNTGVKWVEKNDTTWSSNTREVVLGYDTTYLRKTKKVLIKTEQKETLILDKSQRVHSRMSENNNKTYVFFNLPQNVFADNKTSKVIAWAFWVGVGEESNRAWRENTKVIGSLVQGAASFFISPLGALAAGKITELIIPKNGEDVAYVLTDETNKNYCLSGSSFKAFDEGKGVAGYRAFTDSDMNQGMYFLLFSNDNYVQAIDVNIKVSAIVQTDIYKYQPYTEMKINEIRGTKTFKTPTVTSKLIPITE
jgi:hypothetical protein